MNVVGVDTRFGYRTAELINADITRLAARVDVMMVSAFAGSYHPLEGTVMRALLDGHGIHCEALREDPGLDLCKALGIWVSRELESGPARRLLFVEIRGSSRSVEDVLDNVFAALMVLSAKHIPVQSVSMPLLGAGSQRLPAKTVIQALLPRAKRYLVESPATSLLQFVEVDKGKAELISVAMDEVLGRVRVSLPRQLVADALRKDVRHKLLQSSDLFGVDDSLRDDWLSMVESDQASSVQFGVLSRKLVERILNKLHAPHGHLAGRIKWAETNGIAPWICGYMTVLRHLGNEAAHEHPDGVIRNPANIASADLAAGMYCVERLLDFWGEVSTSRQS